MASSIDKTSVREQFGEIKESFNKLSQAGKVSAETALLFKSLLMLFEIMLAVFMEKKTKKTSNNSGIPPSQSDPDQSTDQPNPQNQKKNEKQNIMTLVTDMKLSALKLSILKTVLIVMQT